MPVLKRFDSDSKKRLVELSISFIQKGKNNTIDLSGNIIGMEFIFMSEFIIVLKKYFSFKKELLDNSFVD